MLVFFPVAACLVLPAVRGDRAVRVFALAGLGLAELVLALPLLSFDLSVAGDQFQEHAAWVPQRRGLNYYLGIDGISILMVLLTIAVLPLCVMCSWTYIGKREKEFHFCLLFMTSAVLRRVLAHWTWSCSTCSGRPCSSPCTCSSRSGAETIASTRRSSSSCTPWPARPCSWQPSWPSGSRGGAFSIPDV